MTTTISTRLLVEIEAVLGELLDDPRAGWGEEHVIECLYCGEYDREPGMAPGTLRQHAEDCPIRRGRLLRGMLKSDIERQ
jgi:hypothetical protein